MESLIINQKKLQAIIFTAFSSGRYPVYMDITKENMKWIHGGTGHVHTMNRDAYGIERHNDSYRHLKLIESMNQGDLVDFFTEEWRKFENDLAVLSEARKPTSEHLEGTEKPVKLVSGNEENAEYILCKSANPLMEYMAQNHNPHCTAIVTSTTVEIVEGIIMSKKK